MLIELTNMHAQLGAMQANMLYLLADGQLDPVVLSKGFVSKQHACLHKECTTKLGIRA